MLAIYIRSLVLVCFAVLAMRLMGKRQVGQLQPFELVVAIMIADLASTPMESLDIPLWRGIIPLAATVTLHQLFTLLSLKSQRMRAFFSGTPTVVIHRGKIDAKALERLCFNLNDLLEELRTGGIPHPRRWAPPSWKPAASSACFPVEPASCHPLPIWDWKRNEGFPHIGHTNGRQGSETTCPCAARTRAGCFPAEAGLFDVRKVLLCYLDTDGQMTVHGFGETRPPAAALPALEEVCW